MTTSHLQTACTRSMLGLSTAAVSPFVLAAPARSMPVLVFRRSH
ncbi:hypothetical protein [Bradyrhizobium sp. STM 3809]|nr:hypothetical protein [Bradyrhizobium sp. STM 3809]